MNISFLGDSAKHGVEPKKLFFVKHKPRTVLVVAVVWVLVVFVVVVVEVSHSAYFCVD